MPIWGLRTVAQVIATGFEGPQHCDEPWPYQFMVSVYHSCLQYTISKCFHFISPTNKFWFMFAEKDATLSGCLRG